jgi:hypothetical protein
MEIGGVGGSTGSYALMPRSGGQGAAASPASPQLSLQQQQQVQQLKQTDQKVKAHEQAHLSAAGGLSIGGASFQYVRGPDGKMYAVGGDVHIDVSPGKTPTETIDKARRIQAAALAPADPSAQDRAVAAAAAQMEAQARAEEMHAKDGGGAGGAGDPNPQAGSQGLSAYSPTEQATGVLVNLFA